MKEIKVSKIDEGLTLEKYIKKSFPNLPLSLIYKTFRKKDIKVNGKRENQKYVLNAGDIVAIYLSDNLFATANNETKINTNYFLKDMIVYEDDNLIIINKPRGLLVQKDKSNDVALDDIVKQFYKDSGSSFTPGPLHRLDRNTCGLIMFAKNYLTSEYMSKVIRDKEQIDKHYITLVKGKICKDGVINKPIKKNEKGSIAHISTIEQGGKEAKTSYRVIKSCNEYSLLDITLHTGRTHQIRLHMSSIEHPVIGDNKYGDFSLNHDIEKNFKFKNQFLCAYKLVFKNLDKPFDYLNNKKVEINLPPELNDLISKLMN